MILAFEEHLVKQGYRESSVRQIVSRLKYLLKNSPFEYEALDAFLLSKYRSGTTGATLCKYVDVIRSFGAFQGLTWAKKIKYYKVEVPHRETFSDEEIEALITLPCPKGYRKEVWKRWSFWLKILSMSGMRAMECSSLRVEQVDFGSNNFILPHTKTDPRKVPIAPNIKDELYQYVQTCDDYLFPSQHPSGHIWRQAWNKHFSVRLKMLNLHRPKLCIHSFRRSFISNLYEEDVDLPDIGLIVGHKSVETTQKYLTLTNKTAQKAILRHREARKSAPEEVLLEYLVKEANKLGIIDANRFSWQITESSLHIEIKQKD